jgi:serine/threonine protein kinase
MAQKWDYVAITEARERFITDYLSKSTIPLLATGTITHQRYEVERVLGIGGVGHVYLVRDLLGTDALTRYALKEMVLPFADYLDLQTRLRAFEVEINRLSLLDHPFIPKIKEGFSDSKRVYLVMEYVEGVTLEEILYGTNGLLDEQQVGGWALQLCEVLTYLHTREPPLIFGDLTPYNVMLTRSDEIRLIDFGIDKRLYSSKPGTMIGTEGYWPPEQYKDEVDQLSDIYALGATLHQLLTGSDPRMYAPFTFDERMPTQLNPTVSEEMEAIIMKCLSYRSDERWQSASEVGDALRHVLKRSFLSSPEGD